MSINFSKLKQLVRGYEPVLLQRLLPQGKRTGHEYVSLNPTRNDGKLGSFKINLRTFKWSDFLPQVIKVRISFLFGRMYED